MAHGILNIAWSRRVLMAQIKNGKKNVIKNVTCIENLQSPMAIIRFTSIWVRCFECGEK